MLSNGPLPVIAGDTDIDKIYSEVDADKNGKISQTENEDAMKKMGAQEGQSTWHVGPTKMRPRQCRERRDTAAYRDCCQL